MHTPFIQQQTLLVLNSGSENPTPSGAVRAVNDTYSAAVVPNTASGVPEQLMVRETFSSVPVVWQSQIVREYRELGSALQELTELGQNEDWKVDAPVLGSALNVAANLMANRYPAPQVFTHGPQSVVFNWSSGSNELYLTISADKVSALITTPQCIAHRVDFLAHEFQESGMFLSSLRSADSNLQVRLLTGTVSDPLEPVF